MLNVIATPGEVTAPLFAEAFARGCGGQHVFKYSGGPWAGFGSPSTWRGLEMAQEAGEDWFYGDHAYFRRRLYYRATKNAYQHDGYGEPAYDRFDRFLIPIKPWQKKGSHIVICAQTQNHYDRRDARAWLVDTFKQLKQHTDRPILLRTKVNTATSLEYDLANAWAVVTHTSNAAVESALHGIPVFPTHACAASRVGKSSLADIENPLYADDRREWAGVLAANQWTLEEIEAGFAWKHLQGG